LSRAVTVVRATDIHTSGVTGAERGDNKLGAQHVTTAPPKKRLPNRQERTTSPRTCAGGLEDRKRELRLAPVEKNGKRPSLRPGAGHRKRKLSIYTNANFQQIATAIGIAVKGVADLKPQFEAAALWFRLDQRRPKRAAPSKQIEKLDQVGKRARRLLKSLGIDAPEQAVDGPGDAEIFQALVLTGEPNENAVLEATRRIGRLVEIVEGISAAAEFQRRAREASIEIAAIGKLTVREGNFGNDAVNDWIAAMLGIYRTLTGKEPATSVGAPMRSNEGKAAGPLIRFLQAAGKPLSIEFSEDAWRSRVRTVLQEASE
jgi:hypothetical protein